MCPIAPGGGYSGNSWWGVCRPALRILTLFQTTKCHFPHPFSELEVVTKRNLTYVFSTLREIMSSLLRLERQQKDFFLSYSLIVFIIETTNTFTQYNRSSLVNHTRFQTKVYTRLHIKTTPKYALWGGIYLI